MENGNYDTFNEIYEVFSDVLIDLHSFNADGLYFSGSVGYPGVIDDLEILALVKVLKNKNPVIIGDQIRLKDVTPVWIHIKYPSGEDVMYRSIDFE